MKLELMGPEGVRQRMAEIQAKLDRISPQRQDPGFEKALLKLDPLRGNIGDQLTPFQVESPGIALGADPGLRGMAREAAIQANIDPNLFDSLVEAESGYNPLARSRAGALGLTQLMPDTAREMGVTDPTDPQQSLKGGANYLAKMIQQFGDIRTALAAYNAGPGAVQRAGGIPPYAETRAYVDKVMRLYESRGAR